MPRHYTDEEKRLVLDRLIANHGDVARTANETGVSDRAIYAWRKEPQFAHLISPLLPHLPHVSQNDSSSSPRPEGEGQWVRVSDLPPETTEAFQILHDKLLTIINTLSNRIEEAIDEAPLNQRVTALSQLIDRIAKLAAFLPEEEDDDPDGKPFEIDYDVKVKDDENDETEEETNSSSARSASESEEDTRKFSPF